MISKVMVTEKQLSESVSDGVMWFKCPKCKEKVGAEPDARFVYCQSCNERIEIINPYF